MSAPASGGDAGARERRLTVVRVREHGGYAEVMFGESARIYRLTSDNPAYAETLRVLRDALAGNRALRVRFNEPNGDLIDCVYVGDAR